MSEQVWHEPVDGFEFSAGEVIVDADYQREKLQACGLPADRLNNFVDASFYIGIGIRHGIENGISAEGNVNMVQRLVQYEPVKLGELLTVKGFIEKVTQVPRGKTVQTQIWFENEAGKKVIDASRMSLKPDPSKTGVRGAGERPAAVIENPSALQPIESWTLTPEQVKAYSTEGNSIHYEMTSAVQAGFRAPIIGGGMGVHYLIAAMIDRTACATFDLDIYFRRPIFWDHQFDVLMRDDNGGMCLASDNKVLTEARINAIA